MKKAGVLVFIAVLFLAISAFSQGLNFTASVDKDKLEIGDQLTLTLVVTGNVQKIPEPKVRNVGDFAPYASGRSQNITFVNGAVTATTQFNFVLVPKKVGTFKIGPAELEIGGQLIGTPPIAVTVLPSGSVPKQPAPAPTEAEVREGLKDIFVTASVDKSKVHVS